MPKLVAVIIVGYKSEKDLPDCLSSLKKSDYSNLRLIFINNYLDNSESLVKKLVPDSIIIENKLNLGFSKANNICIQKALSIKANYILLLNPDTVIDSKCITSLVENSDDNTILQPLVLIHQNGTKTNLINTSGTYLNFLGFSYCSNYQELNSKDLHINENILAASGACMLIPSKIIKHIGTLDDNYFMYYEDLDFCWRARISGYQIKLVKKALVWHKYKFTSSPNKWLYTETSRLYFLFKNFQSKTILKILPLYVVNEILSIFFAIYNRFLFQKIYSYIKVINLVPSIIRYRRSQSNLRIINDNKLHGFINSELSFKEVKIPLNNLYNKIINFYYHNVYLKI